MDSFSYTNSSELTFPVSIKVCSLAGHLDQVPFSILNRHPELKFRGSNISLSDLYATIQLWADSKPLMLPMQTSYKHLKSTLDWDEVFTLPLSYSALPKNTQLAVTVWDLLPSEAATADHRVPFGGTTIPLFNEDGIFNQGRQRCKLHLNQAADGMTNTETPYQIPRQTDELDEMERLEVLMKKHELGEIPANKWLDQLRKTNQPTEFRRRPTAGESPDKLSGEMVIHIEFARFENPVVFADKQYPPPAPLTMLRKPAGPDEPNGQIFGSGKESRLVTLFDPEIEMDNPVETKHRVLVRSNRTGALEGDVRPNSKNRDELNVIMSYGPTKVLTAEAKDLVWKYRLYLTRDKRALTKFVKSVSWTDANEAKQAVKLLPRWTSIDVEDALELLGPGFTHPAVRVFAVERLGKAEDDELQMYLLQLVQALKYEPIDQTPPANSLAGFLIERAAKSVTLGTSLHWYLTVECDDKSVQQTAEHRRLFARVEYHFMLELDKRPDGRERKKVLLRQGEFVMLLTRLSHEVREMRSVGLALKRVEAFLADPANGLAKIDPPLPLPLDPKVLITGCALDRNEPKGPATAAAPDDSGAGGVPVSAPAPAKTRVFTSSMAPMMLTWKCVDGTEYPLIFKSGDDLRQDQLVIQIIMLMDRLLRKEGLDLKLSPYRIVATGATAGMVQFVPSTQMSKVVGGGILNFLRERHPDPTAPLGVQASVMDTYVKSCAGYCVITFLLGVGDRHLENILLTDDGRFFHADFGFILGRDPKPFAPLIKLTREFVDGMGGTEHVYYRQFKEHCFTAYAALRKSSSLILNLFALMTDANIPDIRIEPDEAVLKVMDRFQLDLTEAEAIQYFEQILQRSPDAIMPVVMDHVHGLAQRFWSM